MRFNISAFTATLLFISCSQTNADNLDNLPTQWQQQFKPVIDIDSSLLKPGVGESIAAARTRVDELLKQDSPDSKQLASAYGKLGNLYLTHGLYTSASACYDNAINLAPEHFPWRYYAAYLNHENGNMTAALTRFEEAVAIDPGYLPAQYRLAQVHLELNQLEDAQKLFSPLLDDTKFEAAAHYGLGQVFLVKQDYRQSAEHLTRALELAPEATSIHYPLAMALRALKKSDLAKQHLQKYKKHEIVISDPLVESLEALKDPATRHFVEAMTAVIRKNYTAAIQEFETGFTYKPDNLAARTSYARVLYLTGNKEKSRKQLELITGKNPDKAIALFLLALIHDESNNKAKAFELYGRVLDLNSKHEGANFFVGNYHLHRKDYTNAIKHYDSVISVNDKNIPAHLFRLNAMMSSDASDRELLDAVQKIRARAPKMLSIRRIEILLLALSLDEDVRDRERSRVLAEEIYADFQYPVNLELVALATASTGDFNSATEQMREALTTEKQYQKSRSIKRMSNNLALLEQGELPELNWQVEINHMLPPPTNALATFRDYPDANPI